MAKGCDRCLPFEDAKGGLHHERACPEMFFASGAPRGVTPAVELARFGRLGSGKRLQDELAEIFASVTTVEEEPDGPEA